MAAECPAVSVVVPVYNIKDCLAACVESVLGQTLRDFELILVDDGSTDGSGELCDACAKQDARVKPFHQANAGPAAARNAGLDHATGEYVLFLDADDFYASDAALRQLVEKAEAGGHDVVCFGYFRHCAGKRQHPNKPARRMPALHGLPVGDMPALLAEMTRRNAWQSAAWNRMTRRALLSGLRFPDGIISEDIEFSAEILLRAQNIGILDEAIYAYRAREGSRSRNVAPRAMADTVGILQRLAGASVPADRREAYLGYTAFQYCTLLLNWQLCRPKPDAALKAQAKALAPLLRHDKCPIVRAAHLSYIVAGFDITGRLMLPFRS